MEEKEQGAENTLATQMSVLELKEDGSSDCLASENRRRSLRTKIPVMKTEAKRRVITKPKRLSMEAAPTDIENIYLNQRLTKTKTNLETIYEEPTISKANELMYIGLQKKKRFLNVGESDKGKIKKRRIKARKLFMRNFGKNMRQSKNVTLNNAND